MMENGKHAVERCLRMSRRGKCGPWRQRSRSITRRTLKRSIPKSRLGDCRLPSYERAGVGGPVNRAQHRLAVCYDHDSRHLSGRRTSRRIGRSGDSRCGADARGARGRAPMNDVVKWCRGTTALRWRSGTTSPVANGGPCGVDFRLVAARGEQRVGVERHHERARQW